MDLKHQKYFDCKYPIVCSGMNTVSNVELALAIKRAGCYPSFVAYNHTVINQVLDISTLNADLNDYYNRGGDRNYIIGVSSSRLLDFENFMSLLSTHKPAYVELYDTDYISHPKFADAVNLLHSNGTKILVKCLSAGYMFNLLQEVVDFKSKVDGVIIKGPKAAGRVAKTEIDLATDIKIIRLLFKDLIIIAQGGIHSSDDIKELQDAGADIVSIGTMFAMSEESPIALETKMKMLESSYAETVRIGEANQNGIQFSKMNSDDENNTTGLKLGITTGNKGHVFAGAALDYIKEIRPVNLIVQDLVKGL